MKIQIIRDNQTREVDIYSEEGFETVSELWTKVSVYNKIMYEPTWLGIPIIQYPGDIVAMQELIWKIRPDVIVETGIAHGGSVILHASLLSLVGNRGRVIAVDVDIRHHNKIAIKNHPFNAGIDLIQGSSIDPVIVEQVKKNVHKDEKVLVVLDSNHSYEHVLAEMEAYSDLVPINGYLVVMDGLQANVSDIPTGKEEWKHDNPLRAIDEFIKKYPGWEVDPFYNRFKITSNPKGFLKRVSENNG